MLRPSRRAVVLAASFALAVASLGPSAHAARSGGDPDPDEQSGGLLDLIDVTGLLGLPALGGLGLPALGGLGLPALGALPTVEGLGLPTVEGLGLPALDGLGLPALDGLGVPALGGLGSVPGLDLTVLVQVGLSGTVTLY